ncbi:MAG: peptide chain release factor N(5)-glutamine methyltransferase [Bacteroidales bacterium]|nr:peptide chain release factor N(5)-glutamine methyltransferase [Bacteroidales bacterium]
MNTREMHIPSNKVRDIERYMLYELAAQYPEGEIRTFIRILFDAYLGWDTTQLLMHREESINQSDLLKFHWATEALKQRRPIQHIVGWADFCGLRIKVTPDTLIPRPETEEIVEWIIKNKTNRQHIIDLCTGSGCIAIALKQRIREADIWAMDISEKALRVAQENAQTHNTGIHFLQGDLLKPGTWRPLHESQQTPCTFDLIVSNPPYIREAERAAMDANVKDYEPALALFVPDSDPLRFYRAIAEFAQQHLSDEGTIVAEINEALGSETIQLFEKYGFATTIHEDFRGNPRMLEAEKS